MKRGRAWATLAVALTLVAARPLVAQEHGDDDALFHGRVVLEAGLGAAGSRLACQFCRGDAPSHGNDGSELASHAALGVGPNEQLMFLYSEDGGARFSFEASTPSYHYRTVFAEVGVPDFTGLAVRLGVGHGSGDDFETDRRGSGAVVRAGIAVHTPARHPFGLVLAADAFRGVSGEYRAGSFVDSRAAPFRPLTVQIVGSLRLQGRI